MEFETPLSLAVTINNEDGLLRGLLMKLCYSCLYASIGIYLTNRHRDYLR